MTMKKVTIIVAALLFTAMLPANSQTLPGAGSNRQSSTWTVNNPQAQVADGIVTLSVDVTRSFAGGQLIWPSDNDPDGLYVTGDSQLGVRMSGMGEDIDCPGATYSGPTTNGTEVITFSAGCIPAGTYTMAVYASNIEGGDQSSIACCADFTTSGGDAPAVEYETADVTRLAGGSRYETAVEVSRFQFPNGAGRVTLANANVQVDALPGSQLGGGPILYVPASGEVPQVVLDEVARLNPREIIVLGGALAVDQSVVDQVASQTAHRIN